jgi:hypothetical protein
MQQVSTVPPLPAYAESLADVVAYDVLSAPSPILASAAFWNNFAALSQRIPDPAQLHAFLARLRARLTAPPAQPTAAPAGARPPRFSGQTAAAMLAKVRNAQQPSAADVPSQALAQGPHAYLVWQVDLASQMIAGA